MIRQLKRLVVPAAVEVLVLILLVLRAAPVLAVNDLVTSRYEPGRDIAGTLMASAQGAQSEPGSATTAQGGVVRDGAPAKEGSEGPREESIWGPIARLFNFLVLAGVLYHFLRKPIAAYLADRSGQIRNDLVTAAEMKQSAAAQIAELDRKMAALPNELEMLKQRGHQDVLAEEARIEQVAAAERERLLDQTRREIDRQLRVAHRQLIEHASNLAVGLATDRIRANITPDDQARLVDRYLQQVKG